MIEKLEQGDWHFGHMLEKINEVIGVVNKLGFKSKLDLTKAAMGLQPSLTLEGYKPAGAGGNGGGNLDGVYN